MDLWQQQHEIFSAPFLETITFSPSFWILCSDCPSPAQDAETLPPLLCWSGFDCLSWQAVLVWCCCRSQHCARATWEGAVRRFVKDLYPFIWELWVSWVLELHHSCASAWPCTLLSLTRWHDSLVWPWACLVATGLCGFIGLSTEPGHHFCSRFSALVGVGLQLLWGDYTLLSSSAPGSS